MLGVGFALVNALLRNQHLRSAVAAAWLLSGGHWSDSGVWDDGASWED